MTASKKAGIFTIVDQALVSGSNFLVVFLCARFLDPANQGKLGYLVAANFAAVMVCLTAIFQLASVQSVSQDNPGRYRRQLAAYQVYMGVVSAVLITALAYLLAGLSGWQMAAGEILLLALFLCLQQLGDFDRRSSYIFAHPGRAAVSSASMHVTRVGLLLIVHPTDIQTVLWVLLGSCLVPASLTVMRARSLVGDIRTVARFSMERLRDSRWLSASGIMSWTWGHLIVFFAGALIGLPAVGVLITLRSVTNVANVGIEMLETYGAVFLARLNFTRGSDYASTSRSLALLGFALWTVGLVLILLFGRWIVATLFGDFYEPFWYLMVPLWVVNLGIFLFKLGCIDLRINAQTRKIFQAYVIGVTAGALSIPAGLLVGGLTGGVIAFALTALLLSATAHWYGWSHRQRVAD